MAVFRLALCCCLAVFCGFALSIPATNASSLNDQRQQYQQALKSLRNGNSTQYRHLTEQLKDYPLRPYLDYATLATRLSLSKRRQVEKFLEKYEGQPAANRLHYRWLEYLRKRDRWQDYLKYYKQSISSTQQQCYYHLANYRAGNKAQATEQAIKLWAVGKSQPKGCDRLFGVLIKDKKITEDIAWQRFTKAVFNHQYQLARYLKRFFTSKRYQQLADTFYKVDRNPAVLTNYSLFAEHPPEILRIIEHGLTHLAKTDAQKALGLWGVYHQTHPFSAKSETTIISALIKGLYYAEQIKASDTLLLESRDKVDIAIFEWRLRKALADNNWKEASFWISKLPSEYQQDKRWQYWSIRARLATNKISDDQANKEYAAMAGSRNFYSFLASDRLNIPYSFTHKPINVSKKALKSLDNQAEFKRIRELHFHEEMNDARREWSYATRNLSEGQLLTAAQWATDLNWPDRAITSMIQAGYWDDIDIRFPTPYKKDFEKNAKQTQVPIQLLYALARQESALKPDATSHVGARGLIQLMPATAKETAKKHGIKYSGTSELHKPSKNIALGSRYYADMLKRFDNKILASAAYNAGPHRVSRWLKDSNGTRPFDVWIETIPYKETRGYVQNVLAFSAIYAHHLGLEQDMLSKKERQSTL